MDCMALLRTKNNYSSVFVRECIRVCPTNGQHCVEYGLNLGGCVCLNKFERVWNLNYFFESGSLVKLDDSHRGRVGLDFKVMGILVAGGVLETFGLVARMIKVSRRHFNDVVKWMDCHRIQICGMKPFVCKITNQCQTESQTNLAIAPTS